MGAIFEAEHLATERRVALKLLFPHIMSVASARQKFELEAKVSARVNSPYIVEVLDAGFDEASKSPYLVMELLEGQTLAARVREQGPLGVDETLRLLEQVAAGLDAAHGYKEASGTPKPIVHRDLKPENLFLARQHDGSIVAKILDYGIAKVLGDTTHISQEVRGTPLFMAFEQVTAGVLSPQTDVWAFGLITYHMLTGARYWRSAERPGASVQSLFAEILTLPLEAPSARLREQKLDVSLPPAFDAWLLRCIDREPRQRYASAGAAVEALGRVFERAPRAAAARPSVPLTRSSDNKTQTFIAPDGAARAAAAAAAASLPPVAAVGSVPALSATKHRRSFPSRVMTSPLHWAGVGAAGGVFVLGLVLWLATRNGSPSHESPVTASEPASSVQAARPGPEPAAAAARPHPEPASTRSTTSEPVQASTTSPEPSAPRVRVAPVDETPAAPSSAAGGSAVVSPAPASSAGPASSPLATSGSAPARAPSAAPRTKAPAPVVSAVPRAPSTASNTPSTPPAVTPSPALTPAAAPTGITPAGTALTGITPAGTAPAPPKRPRKPTSSSEAYKTR